MEIQRKTCGRCHAVYEGEAVSKMYSCEQCGNGSLGPLTTINTPEGENPAPLPRSGSPGTITHTRDSF